MARTREDVEDALRRVADVTGARPETLQRAINASRLDPYQGSVWLRLRRQWERLTNGTKRIAISAFAGTWWALADKLGDRFGDDSGLWSVAQSLIIIGAIYNVALAKKRQLGVAAGIAFGLAAIVSSAIFALILRVSGVEGSLLIPVILGAGLLGGIIAPISDRILARRMPADPERKRQELLKQLIELQDELKQHEQVVTFLSVDVVNSTGIKREADPLSAEYSFGEYTQFVTNSGNQFGGVVHSTAGDGVLLAFEHPYPAFQAARRIQAGLPEFNQHRNKTGIPFSARCGIHTGAVMAAGGDIRSVAFSHVIDMTTHVQRLAPEDGIAVTEDAAAFMPGGTDCVGEEVGEVQGKRTYLWRPPAPAPSAAAFDRPPPPPINA
jgi:class 3 adenylate cyclase